MDRFGVPGGYFGEGNFGDINYGGGGGTGEFLNGGTITGDVLDGGGLLASLTSQPRMLVIPSREVNFTDVHIQFDVHVVNLPFGLDIGNLKFDGFALTPSGTRIRCSFRRISQPPVEFFQSIRGYFKSTSEGGLYSLNVRVFLPPPPGEYFRRKVCVSDTAMIRVSRSYYRDARYGDGWTYVVDPGLLNGHSVFDTSAIFSNGSGDESFGSQSQSFVDDNNNNHVGWRQRNHSKVWGLACDKPTNRVFVSDRKSNKVYCIDPSTQEELFFIDGAKADPDTLNRPTGLAVDEFNRRLIVADKDNHRICVYSLDGHFIATFGSEGHYDSQFSYPWDVAIKPDGSEIAVADSRNRRVQLFDSFGNFTGKFSVFETMPYVYKQNFDYPRGIAFDVLSPHLYVTDFNNHNVIQVWRNMTTFRKLINNVGETYQSIRRPQGITVDDLGALLVCDSKNNCVRHISEDGRVISMVNYVKDHQVVYPVNVTIMAGGKVAVLDGLGMLHVF